MIKCVGVLVKKISGKPFKSGLKVSTVKGITTNPFKKRNSFYFYEDSSIVECRACEIILGENYEN